jgi:hypothetical protein
MYRHLWTEIPCALPSHSLWYLIRDCHPDTLQLLLPVLIAARIYPRSVTWEPVRIMGTIMRLNVSHEHFNAG